MRSLSLLLTPVALSLCFIPALHADTITDNFSLGSGGHTYAFSLTDGQAPSLTQTYISFDVYTYYNVPITYDGVPHGREATVVFSDISFDLELGSTIANYPQVQDLNEANVQLYGGSVTNPTYAAGTVIFPYAHVTTVSPPYFLPVYSFTLGDVLTISKSSDASPVPEPASLLLLGTGLAAGCGLLRRRRHLLHP